MRLTRNNFRIWLKSHRPRQVVGYRLSNELCPIARFVGMDFRCYQPGHKPTWVYKFVGRIDASGKRNSRVTASKALELLEGKTA